VESVPGEGDYILTQSFILQIFKLMDLTLKSTDPENPVIHARAFRNQLVDTIREHVQVPVSTTEFYEINFKLFLENLSNFTTRF